jgi:hypothetical protein
MTSASSFSGAFMFLLVFHREPRCKTSDFVRPTRRVTSAVRRGKHGTPQGMLASPKAWPRGHRPRSSSRRDKEPDTVSGRLPLSKSCLPGEPSSPAEN